MTYTVNLSMTQRPALVVVGCGGTGGFVAEGICRLEVTKELTMMLVDPDRVEPSNLLRQNFFGSDMGKFKSQCLAERLASKYGRRIGYSVWPYDREMFNENMGGGLISRATSLIIIGCVDNPFARRDIAKSLHWDIWWLDSGNSFNSGQVLLGNTADIGYLKEAFDLDSHQVSKLPSPSIQLPALLIPTAAEKTPDCAEAVEDNRQSPVINQVMAALVLDFLNRLLLGKLTYMGVYVDLDAPSLSHIPVNPATFSRMTGLKLPQLMANKCALGERYHV